MGTIIHAQPNPKNNSDTIWLVEPRDAASNENIIKYPGVEVEGEEIIGKDGVPHNLHRVRRYQTIATLIASRKHSNLKFNLFIKHGTNGEPEPAEFITSRKKKRPSKSDKTRRG